MSVGLHDNEVRLPPSAVRFPVELRRPLGFQAERPETWPDANGRLELLDGRILFMPPCGALQQDVVADVVYALRRWSEGRPDFIVGTNEAGMLLGGDVRAADVAVWRRSEAGPQHGGYRRTPPVLAVEVAGLDEGEQELREKATWYFRNGVALVWLILPETRVVLVLTAEAESRFEADDRLAPCSELPGLQPTVSSLFAQLA